mmetsp:Transcript_44851/g.72033  ORF Transcript_44851/g.72033 Transcript_44851/m.72033 type:complete len:425 (+) Transcript_44851:165-1439(+)
MAGKDFSSNSILLLHLSVSLLTTNALVIKFSVNGKLLRVDHTLAMFGPQAGYVAEGPLIIPQGVNDVAQYGCLPLRDPHVNGTVVLLKRGKCTFLQKAIMVQRAGAIALVVGDNYEPQENPNPHRLVKMVAVDQKVEVQIPSIFIRGVDHRLIREEYMQYTNLEAIVSNDGEVDIDVHTSHKLRSTPIVFLFLIALLPISWCLLRFADRVGQVVRRRINRRRFVNFAATIPEQKFQLIEEETKISDSEEMQICLNSTCVICLEDFKNGENIKVLPCKHGFHTQCIMPWFERSGDCPICKKGYNQYTSSFVPRFSDRARQWFSSLRVTPSRTYTRVENAEGSHGNDEVKEAYENRMNGNVDLGDDDVDGGVHLVMATRLETLEFKDIPIETPQAALLDGHVHDEQTINVSISNQDLEAAVEAARG